MRSMTYWVAAAALAAGVPTMAATARKAPATGSGGPAATAQRFIDTFDRGDVTGAAATMTADVVIIDEFPPHVWSGPGAFTSWAGDLDKADKAAGDTGDKATLGRPAIIDIEGNVAYVVFPATLTYSEKGKSIFESGARVAFAFRKQGGDWKISGWAWAGGVTRPLAATVKAARKPRP